MTRKTLRQIINEELRRIVEGASPILYRYVSVDGFCRLLRTNKLRPRKKEGEVDKGGYFISFTRNKNFFEGFPMMRFGDKAMILIRIQFDGDLLNTRNNYKTIRGKRRTFKIEPFDWSHHEMGEEGYPYMDAEGNMKTARNGKEFEMHNNSERYSETLGKFHDRKGHDGWRGYYKANSAHELSQSEDRLFATSKLIPNAFDYIQAVDIYIDPDCKESRSDMKNIEQLYKNVKNSKYRVLCRFYDDLSNFNSQRKSSGVEMIEKMIK